MDSSEEQSKQTELDYIYEFKETINATETLPRSYVDTALNFGGMKITLSFYNCPFCTYETTLFGFLKAHVATHTTLKLKHCQYCVFTTFGQKNLNHHIKLFHWEEQVYRCKQCDYRTSRAASLNHHKISAHMKNKPYICGECGYSCTFENNLKIHIFNIHLKRRSFACHICDYRAALQSTLKTHIMAKHEKIKPYSCHDCQYTASQIGTLNRHIKTRHGKDKPIKGRESIMRGQKYAGGENHLKKKLDMGLCGDSKPTPLLNSRVRKTKLRSTQGTAPQN